MADEHGGGIADGLSLAEQLRQALSLFTTDPARAVEALTPLATSSDPLVAGQSCHLIGLLHMRAGKKSEAIEFLARAVDADVLDAAYSLGALLADAGRLD